MSGAAQRAVRSAKSAGDPQTTYAISGKTLTISSTNPVLLEFVRGSDLLVQCYAASNTKSGTSGYGDWGK